MGTIHGDVERLGLVNRYVNGQLDDAARGGFEEHFFSCDRCFADVQDAERFEAAMRDAAARGLLDSVEDGTPSGKFGWTRVLAGLATAAAIVFAATAAWLGLVVVRNLRQELTAARGGRELVERQLASERSGDLDRQSRAAREQQMASTAEANVPVVILQGVRGAPAAARITPPAGARHILLWIDSAAGSGSTFRLAISRADGVDITTVEGLHPNAQGALAAAVPAALLPSGSYVVRQYRTDTAEAPLVGQYRLDVVPSGR